MNNQQLIGRAVSAISGLCCTMEDPDRAEALLLARVALADLADAVGGAEQPAESPGVSGTAAVLHAARMVEDMHSAPVGPWGAAIGRLHALRDVWGRGPQPRTWRIVGAYEARGKWRLRAHCGQSAVVVSCDTLTGAIDKIRKRIPARDRVV